MADSAYAKVYVNGVRVANVPSSNLRTIRDHLGQLSPSPRHPNTHASKR